MRLEHLTDQIIGAFYEVYNNLGYGFLEKVYENSLCTEFQRRGIDFARQVLIRVHP